MNHAFEKMKMMVGMEVEEEQRASEEEEEEESSLSFMDDLNQDCALTTKQVPKHHIPAFSFECVF